MSETIIGAPARRVRMLRISPSCIAALLSEGSAFRTSKGLPPGCSFAAAFIERKTREVCLYVEHESFAPVRDGGLIPEMDGFVLEDLSDATFVEAPKP